MGTGDFHRTSDLVLVATGVRPLTNVARGAEITLGEQGAIQVTRRMETNLPYIYAAGDCAETWHRFLGVQPFPWGILVDKQGRIAGENAVGGSREFSWTAIRT